MSTSDSPAIREARVLREAEALSLSRANEDLDALLHGYFGTEVKLQVTVATTLHSPPIEHAIASRKASERPTDAVAFPTLDVPAAVTLDSIDPETLRSLGALLGRSPHTTAPLPAIDSDATGDLASPVAESILKQYFPEASARAAASRSDSASQLSVERADGGLPRGASRGRASRTATSGDLAGGQRPLTGEHEALLEAYLTGDSPAIPPTEPPPRQSSTHAKARAPVATPSSDGATAHTAALLAEYVAAANEATPDARHTAPPPKPRPSRPRQRSLNESRRAAQRRSQSTGAPVVIERVSASHRDRAGSGNYASSGEHDRVSDAGGARPPRDKFRVLSSRAADGFSESSAHPRVDVETESMEEEREPTPTARPRATAERPLPRPTLPQADDATRQVSSNDADALLERFTDPAPPTLDEAESATPNEPGAPDDDATPSPRPTSRDDEATREIGSTVADALLDRYRKR